MKRKRIKQPAEQPRLLPDGAHWSAGAQLGTHVLRKGDRTLATVVPSSSGYYFITPGGYSTFRKPVATVDEAMRLAETHWVSVSEAADRAEARR